MLLTSEQHFRIAVVLETLADDASLSPEDRADYAREANWFQILAKLAAETTTTPIKIVAQFH